MFDKIFNAWKDSTKIYRNSQWFQRLEKRQLGVEHYKGYLLETYHHAGINPQIQAYATLFFKDNPREIIGKFFRHAGSEIGHDLMAAKDLQSLDVEEKFILSTKPLPMTLALNAFVLHLIQFVSPVSYLGYLFHLEFLPTQNGRDYIDLLKASGVPTSALSFLEEHSSVDVGHNKLMREYIEVLVKDKKCLDEVVYAATSTSLIHLRMVEDAFENGERIFGTSSKKVVGL